MFSDGYRDQFGGPENKKFMSDRFEKLLKDNYHKEVKEQFKILDSTFEEWKGNNKQIDDVLVIGMKFNNI